MAFLIIFVAVAFIIPGRGLYLQYLLHPHTKSLNRTPGPAKC